MGYWQCGHSMRAGLALETRLRPPAPRPAQSTEHPGARIYARGGNMVPMDELEARVSDRGLRQLVRSAAAANMNMLRIWGGGVFLPQASYSGRLGSDGLSRIHPKPR